MNVRDNAGAHRRRRTVAKAVGVLVAAGAGAFAAALLWQTAVPDLDLPPVDPHAYFEQGELERIERFRTVTRGLWAAWITLELVVLAALVWKASTLVAYVNRFAHGRVRTGVSLGLIAVLAVWGARLPVAAVWHWWERRYGLSRQSYPAWLGDQAISVGVRAALVCLAVAGAVALAVRLGRRWWVAGAPALVAMATLFVLAQPVVIQPLFNRFEPLADRRLAARIERIADRMGVDVERVEVADASRRTTAGNAYVAGIGPTRRVVLYDTILDGRFGDDEVVAISAHELAHVARRHLWKGLAWFALLAVPGLYLLARFTEPRGGLRDPALVPFALLLALAFFLATLPLQNAVSRRYEAEADWLALEATGDAAAAVELDGRLVRSSLGDPDPPAWTKLFLATHPSALDRIAMAEAFRAREAR
ncbi:MAG: M48 family metalloprotease [Actinomycetota bacterium]|nr:M48 family metalloprotease [Actinomycetota bacterium]